MNLKDDCINKNTIRAVTHNLLLNFDQECLFESTFPKNVKVELPYPISDPVKKWGDDTIAKLVENTRLYNEEEAKLVKEYPSEARNITTEQYGDSDFMSLPKKYLRFYNTPKPDPFISSEYNSYYTGGFLDHFFLCGEHYLTSCDTENNINITSIKNQTRKNIFQTTTSVFNIRTIQCNQNILMLLREKYKVSVLNISSDLETNVVWNKIFDNSIIDARINQFNTQKLGIINSKSELHILDTKTNKSVKSISINNDYNCDKFVQFEFIDANTILAVDRFSVRTIDSRSKEQSVIKPELHDCNCFCTFNIKEDNLILASKHSLMATDLRSPGKFRCYSHSFKSPPCYMTTISKQNESFVCISSQHLEEKLLYTGEPIYSIPFTVPNILDTYKECQLRKDILLRDEFPERISYSTAGLKLLNIDNEIVLFSSNSLGEIFKQKVLNAECDIKKPVEIFYNWVTAVEMKPHKLYPTCIEDLSDIRFSLPNRCKKSSFQHKSKASKFIANYYKSSIRKTKNPLGQKMLSLWLDDEEISDESTDDEEDLPEVPAHDKVNSWIQNQDFDDDNSLNMSFVIGEKS